MTRIKMRTRCWLEVVSSPALAAFESKLNGLCSCKLSLNDLYTQADQSVTSPTLLRQELLSKQIAIVDYSKGHHINVRAPLFGTASATVKLAADGSLTEATGAVDSSKMADLIPAKELFVDKWGLEHVFASGAFPSTPTPILTMSIERNGFVYTIEKYHANPPVTLSNPPLTFTTADTSITRTKLGAKGKGKAEKNSISFSGDVKLPKK